MLLLTLSIDKADRHLSNHYESITNTSQVPPVHNPALAPQGFMIINAACYKLTGKSFSIPKLKPAGHEMSTSDLFQTVGANTTTCISKPAILQLQLQTCLHRRGAQYSRLEKGGEKCLEKPVL